MTETAQMRAAREAFANDLKGLSDDALARELADRQTELDELESWVEALTAERAFRKHPPKDEAQIDLVDYLAGHPA